MNGSDRIYPDFERISKLGWLLVLGTIPFFLYIAINNLVRYIYYVFSNFELSGFSLMVYGTYCRTIKDALNIPTIISYIFPIVLWTIIISISAIYIKNKFLISILNICVLFDLLFPILLLLPFNFNVRTLYLSSPITSLAFAYNISDIFAFLIVGLINLVLFSWISKLTFKTLILYFLLACSSFLFQMLLSYQVSILLYR